MANCLIFKKWKTWVLRSGYLSIPQLIYWTIYHSLQCILGLKVLQWNFLNGAFYLPNEVKKEGLFVSLKRLCNYFVKPLGAFLKQLGQFYVKTQWTKAVRKPNLLNQQLDYLRLSLTSGPIPPGNRMNTRYKETETVWTSSCSICSS